MRCTLPISQPYWDVILTLKGGLRSWRIFRMKGILLRSFPVWYATHYSVFLQVSSAVATENKWRVIVTIMYIIKINRSSKACETWCYPLDFFHFIFFILVGHFRHEEIVFQGTSFRSLVRSLVKERRSLIHLLFVFW